MRVTVEAPAKINLMLDIFNRLDNGYHTLWMAMQSVSLCDTVSVETGTGKEIRLTCSEPAIPTDETNIACRAARAFLETAQIGHSGLAIHIEKRIPFAAGLAGGSADGAAVLLALNELFHTGMTTRQLCWLGLKIGADIPFCLRGGTMLAQHIGELLSPLPDVPDCSIVLAKPEMEVSTAQAYGAFDAAGFRRPPDKERMLDALLARDLVAVGKTLGNVFEQFIEVPQRATLKALMRENHALGCCMSGSGPTVFGLFERQEDAERAAREADRIADDVFVCRPRTLGCKIIASV